VTVGGSFRAGPASARRVRILCLALGLVVVAPLLRPGFVLVYDMVFVPHPPFSLGLLGVSRLLPRDVPVALAVASLSRLLTGQVVQKLALLGIFAVGGYGAARLVPARTVAGRMAAGIFYVWNPFTYERLLLGHWTLLLGYAALPWVARAAIQAREGSPRALSRLVLALAVAAIPDPYTGIIGGVIAFGLLVAPPWGRAGSMRRATLALGSAVAVNLPWLVPAALHPRVHENASLGVALFHARADSPLGTLGSLMSLGGLWRTDLAPPGRTTFAWIPAFLLIAALTVMGWRRVRDRWPNGALTGLLVVAALGLLLAWLPSIGFLRGVFGFLGRSLPGGDALRDSQKFVMPLALAGSVGFGLGVDRIIEASHGSSERWLRRLAPVAAILPVALAPSLAWGAGGRLSPVTYPSSWARVEAITSADPTPGGMLALPWHAYLPFGWNHGRTVHQPAIFYFSRPVVASSALEVGSNVIPEEDPWAALARPAVTGRGPLLLSLRRLGIRYVVVFKEADWRGEVPRLGGLATAFDRPDLTLYRVAGPGPEPGFARPPVGAVGAGDVVTLAVLLLAAAGMWSRRTRSRRQGML
jgi:hypothetical protein